ncbi:MAG: VWA domain-containing protein [Nitrososphaerota archaeon]|nr:VWA domain-containing protein [Nitrososphaerota archaeon]
MSYDESKAKDMFFIIDGSRSMKEKVKASGMSKMEMVKQGLFGFVEERWPVSYMPWPLRIGVAFFRLLGTPGKTEFDVVVPLNPPPASLELYRLNEMPCKGGSPLADALRYAVGEVADSLRGEKRIKLISDGGNDGEPLKNVLEELKRSKTPVDAIELSNSASQELRDAAAALGGRYYRPNGLAEFKLAIRE